MAIKPSSAAEIGQLVDALAGADEIRREASIARLAIIGSRATDRLIARYLAAEGRDRRGAILRVLERTGDPRSLPIARHALAEGGDLAVSGTAVLRTLLDHSEAAVAGEALDLLVAAALDRAAEHRVRLAAYEAIEGTSEDLRRQVGDALRGGPAGIARGVSLDDPGRSLAAVWADAAEGHLPDDPSVLRAALDSQGPTAPLTLLQRLVDRIREREQNPAWANRRDQWRAVRGAVHQVLALRDSRVALYDLRESLEAADGALPPSFLAALQILGDASCLEALASAWCAAAGDQVWRSQVTSTFRAVARRRRISKRHAVMKRIASRWPEAASSLTAPT